MSDAMKAFVDFLHDNKENPRVIKYSDKLFDMAHAMQQAESVGIVLDPESVVEACNAILEG